MARVLIQLKPELEEETRELLFYRAWDFTFNRPIPIMGLDPKIIEGRIRQMFPNDSIRVEVDDGN